jgi:hypothetical protein
MSLNNTIKSAFGIKKKVAGQIKQADVFDVALQVVESSSKWNKAALGVMWDSDEKSSSATFLLPRDVLFAENPPGKALSTEEWNAMALKHKPKAP